MMMVNVDTPLLVTRPQQSRKRHKLGHGPTIASAPSVDVTPTADILSPAKEGTGNG